MSEILFLSHRIPYPPNKGDKIRSFHLLRTLAERHTVHLGAFVDDPADWDHLDVLRKFCGETCLRPLSPTGAKLRSATGLLTAEPLSVAYYRDRTLSRWVLDLASRRPLAGVFAFSSSMGQYAEHLPLQTGAVRVLDFCDVDSDKWRQYAASHGWPLRLIYAREASRLADTEARYVRGFDASCVVSEAEARILRSGAGGHLDRIRVVSNGVDAEYFDPACSFDRPFAPGVQPIVFTGAMDYHANVDGVRWFAHKVFPLIHKHVPSAVFAVVGSSPVPEVSALAEESGIIVTGRVPDVRPYLAHAAVVVAPLRIARGVQNKVLEALAMARPVVATENAVQGIPEAGVAGVCIRSRPDEFADAVVERLSTPEAAPRGRLFVREHYDWRRELSAVGALFP
jgi:sugar transferase (PEP-CTERM/EpsH1 system associated)